MPNPRANELFFPLKSANEYLLKIAVTCEDNCNDIINNRTSQFNIQLCMKL